MKLFKQKWFWVVLGAFLVGAVAGTIFWFANRGESGFYLDEKYYGESRLEEVDAERLQELINEGGAFGVLVHQPMCAVSTELVAVVEQFQSEQNMSFYKIAFSKLKEGGVAEELKYYPSFLIYREGKLVDFLEADNNEDTEKYKNLGEFSDWFFEKVKKR